MTDRITGSCLCGKVEFEVKNKFEDLYFCYCKQCQKISGSAHVSNLFGEPDGFHWVKGEDLVKRFKLPGRDFNQAFCSECGSGLPFMNTAGTKIIVPAGALDSEPNFSRQSKIFYVEQAQWSQTGEATKNYDGFPED